MKRIILPVTFTIIVASCNTKSKEKTGDKETTAPTTSTEKKVERLDPATVDVNKPIDAIEANYQINCWDGKKIEVVGNGVVFYGDSIETKTGIGLTDSMGNRKGMISCRFVSPPAIPRIANSDMIHIRGRINGNFNGEIIMDSCEIVAIAKSISTQPVDPFGKSVMSAAGLFQDYFKWDGKEISVIGDYYMTTTSTTSYGTSIRVDLKNTATNEKVVGCDFKEDPSKKIEGNEKGVIIKGKVKTNTPYGYLMLEGCSLVNR